MSEHEHMHGIGSEHPRSHEIQLFCLGFFFIVWFIDSFFVKMVQVPNDDLLIFRLLVFILFAIISYRLVNGSHKLVLRHVNKSKPKVVSEDVYSLLRHPMYSAFFLLYIGLMQLTLSILSIIPLIINYYLLNKIASFEEKELIKILGQDYVDYMDKVPRWIPNPLKFFRNQK